MLPWQCPGPQSLLARGPSTPQNLPQPDESWLQGSPASPLEGCASRSAPSLLRPGQLRSRWLHGRTRPPAPPQGLTPRTAVTSWPWLGSRPGGSRTFGGCLSWPPARALQVLVWWEVMAGGCLGTQDGWRSWPWEPEAGDHPRAHTHLGMALRAGLHPLPPLVPSPVGTWSPSRKVPQPPGAYRGALKSKGTSRGPGLPPAP